ncbi:insulinase family protein [Burkholderiaceae bacterium DAT-1]|nr:insulinase family protein [Burkholderiaceae bacterium DAT-1]
MKTWSMKLCAAGVALAVFNMGQQAFAAPVKSVKAAVALPELVQGATASGITEYHLPNGLRVLLAYDPASPQINTQVRYGVGSRDERQDEFGMAHILEHMLFKRSQQFPDMKPELQKLGVSWNAFTNIDETVYVNGFVSNDEVLDRILAWEADRMTGALLEADALDKEMTVVRNEWERGENNPARVLQQRMTAIAFESHPYHHPTIGYKQDIEKVDVVQLKAFYQRFYRPDNAVLVITGKFDEKRVKETIRKAFAGVKHPSESLKRIEVVEAPQDGARFVELRRPGTDAFRAIGYRIPGCTHPDAAAITMASVILNMRSGRLYKQLVETKEAKGASLSTGCAAQPTLAYVWLNLLKEGDADAVENKAIRLVEGLATQAPTTEEYAQAKAAIANQVHQASISTGTLVQVASARVHDTDWRYGLYQLEQLDRVTPEEVQRVMATYFKPASRVIGRFFPTEHPDRTEMTPVGDRAALVKDYVGKKVEEGEEIAPTTAALDARTERFTLANGVKVALLNKKTRGNKVWGGISFRFGNVEERTAQRRIASLLRNLLGDGSVSLSKTELDARINALQSSYSLNVTSGGVSLGVSSDREHLVDLLGTLADVLHHPRFPGEDFERHKNRWIDNLKSPIVKPETVTEERLDRYFSPMVPQSDPFHYWTRKETIDAVSAISLDQVKAFYNDMLGMSEGEIVFVGDFDTKALKAALSEQFGQWAGKKPFVKTADPYRDVAPVRMVTETPDEKNASYRAQAWMPISYDSKDRIALRLASLLLGGDQQSRLWKRVREQDGITYGIGSSLSLDRDDEYATWIISATFAPENRTKIETAIREELDRARRDGFTKDELERAREGELRNLAQLLGFDSARLGLLQSTLRWNDPLSKFDNEVEKLKAVTLDEVNAAMRTWFDPQKLSVSIAGDFAKHEGKLAGERLEDLKLEQ